jgi:Flp pilus assembly protein TadG
MRLTMWNIVKQRLTVLGGSASGAVAVTTAILLAVFLGLAAMAFDIGHLAVVKSELQRTADAAALAGAMGLTPYTGTMANPTPDWQQGQSKAHEVIAKTANEADNQVFSATDGTVTGGYWSLNPPANYSQLSTVRPTATYQPQPAINVTLNRNVTLFLAPVVGGAGQKTVSATATAIIPETYSVGNIAPVAVSQDTVYNYTDGNKVLDLSDQDVKPQSNKGDAAWFNLDGGNSVPSVRYSQPLTSAQTQIYLVPGTKATLTDTISQGQTIVLPVVDDVTQKASKNIIGFAAFYVQNLDANSMHGHFVNKFFDPSVLPTAYNNTYSPVWGTPRLVQ